MSLETESLIWMISFLKNDSQINHVMRFNVFQTEKKIMKNSTFTYVVSDYVSISITENHENKNLESFF